MMDEFNEFLLDDEEEVTGAPEGDEESDDEADEVDTPDEEEM